jgi:hypothetical protein
MKWTDVLYPRATRNASNKENTFPILFFGVYLIFLFFLEYFKKNKVILRYSGGTSTKNIQAQGARTTLMF